MGATPISPTRRRSPDQPRMVVETASKSLAENSYAMISRSKRLAVMNKAASKVIVRDMVVLPS
jgi:hypothetical protein